MGNKYRYWTKMEAMDLQPDCLTLLDKGTGSCHSASSKRSWKKWKMVKWHAVFRSWHRNYVGGGSGSTHLGKNKLTNTLNFTNLKQNCFWTFFPLKYLTSLGWTNDQYLGLFWDVKKLRIFLQTTLFHQEQEPVQELEPGPDRKRVRLHNTGETWKCL